MADARFRDLASPVPPMFFESLGQFEHTETQLTLLVVATLVATLLPARRALGIDPAETLAANERSQLRARRRRCRRWRTLARHGDSRR